MGWASGSELAENVWDLVREHIPEDKLQEVANQFIDAFEDKDCDTMEECEQLMEDAQRPDMCWDCGKEFTRGSLEENDGLCFKCNMEIDNE